jgi:Carboxypeptidase regulatory-like domain
MLLENLRIAAPCPAEWNKMEGDERVRFCHLCQKSVYDVSALTRRQAEALLRKNGTTICTVIYRRQDGTVLTQDCPFGLAAIRRRFARIAGAAFSAMLSVTSSALAQQPRGADQPNSLVQIGGESQGEGAVAGKVSDQSGALIPNAVATLINQSTGRDYKVRSDQTGQYEFRSLPNGAYTVTLQQPGFRTFSQKDLIIGMGRQSRVDATLLLGETGSTINIEPVATLLVETGKPAKRHFGWLHKK